MKIEYGNMPKKIELNVVLGVILLNNQLTPIIWHGN